MQEVYGNRSGVMALAIRGCFPTIIYSCPMAILAFFMLMSAFSCMLEVYVQQQGDGFAFQGMHDLF